MKSSHKKRFSIFQEVLPYLSTLFPPPPQTQKKSFRRVDLVFDRFRTEQKKFQTGLGDLSLRGELK